MKNTSNNYTCSEVTAKDKWDGIVKIGTWNGTQHAFLSNFTNCPVEYEGDIYATSEHAFQGAKVAKQDRGPFLAYGVSPAKAKAMGKKLVLYGGRAHWESKKIEVMSAIITDKFSETRNPDLRAKLLATGWEPLVERNNWGDKIWGTVNGVGRNELGNILMAVRALARGEEM
jgi:ribA/ribD-fused uncharacterized protein